MADNTPSSAPAGVSAWWRASAITLAVLLALGTATSVSMFEQFKAQIQHVQKQLKDTGQVKYIAVLGNAKFPAAMLVTMSVQDTNIQIQRLNDQLENSEESLQLWALSEGDPIRSLGVLGSKAKTLQIPLDEREMASATTLAISVEHKGGADAGKAPQQPFLWQGPVIRKAL